MSSLSPEIPVIDIRGLASNMTPPADVVAELAEAAESVGFFAVQNHGIKPRVFQEMREMLVRLFALGEDVKRRGRIQRDNYRGFIPLGFFTPNRDDPNAPAPDLYEGYKLHWDCSPQDPPTRESPIYGPNRWPADLPDLQPLVLDYWRCCDHVEYHLLAAFEVALGLEPLRLRSLFRAPVSNMTLLHYPPTSPGQAGIHPHKDTNVLTLLHPDPIGGLQVRTRSGEWIEALCPPDALLVNTGDMMEVWSGGRFLSTPHRVTNASGQERYSFPYFSVPGHDVVIEPMVTPVPDYVPRPPITVGPWSLEVWRTNWPDATPEDDASHLGTIDF